VRVATVIDPSERHGWVDLREVWAYRDLFYFLVWRDIKTRYAQSVLGIGWAIIQPLFSMVVFTVVFGNMAKISSDGVPYAIFSFAALVPWTYFSGALTSAGGSLLTARGIITKVYFPRIIVPLVAVVAKLWDFGIALLILFGLMAYFGFVPTAQALLLPAITLLMILTVAGVGMWLTALALQYRDIQYSLGFGVQLLMYASPVVYPVSMVPERFRVLYNLVPMAGVIEGFRSVLLGTNPIPWDALAIGAGMALLLALSGGAYFMSMERRFADVV
jgi:lipopolysaccharide transport system permease protein